MCVFFEVICYVIAVIAGLPTIYHIFAHTIPVEERSRAFGYLVAFGSIGQTAAAIVSRNTYQVKQNILVDFMVRPDFFYFMVYRYFWALLNVWIRNKNKNKISVMSDMHWWSMRLLSKRKPIFTHTEKLTI